MGKDLSFLGPGAEELTENEASYWLHGIKPWKSFFFNPKTKLFRKYDFRTDRLNGKARGVRPFGLSLNRTNDKQTGTVVIDMVTAFSNVICLCEIIKLPGWNEPPTNMLRVSVWPLENWEPGPAL